jgi:transposase
MGALRTKNTYLAAQYARLRPRLGHAQALVAVEHSILVAIFYMLQPNQPYHDLGADYFIRQLGAIGYTIQAQPPPPAAA